VGESGRRSGRPDRNARIGADDADARDPFDEPAQGPLTDWIRRFAALGLSGFFTTESAIRKAFGDTVPQEWIDFVTEQGDRGRQELFDRVAAEFGRVLERVDLEELFENLVTGRTIEIDAKVRIGPRTRRSGEDEQADEGVTFEVRSRRTD